MNINGKIDYDPFSGKFTWIVNSHKNRVGDEAGRINEYGYLLISVNGKRKFAHRLAWLLFYGWLPPKGIDIDHKNRVKTDNRIENLRMASRNQNSWNCNMCSHNTSGFRGVCWHKGYKKWVARVHVNRKCVFQEFFDSFDDACDVVSKKRKEIYKEFAGY